MLHILSYEFDELIRNHCGLTYRIHSCSLVVVCLQKTLTQENIGYTKSTELPTTRSILISTFRQWHRSWSLRIAFQIFIRQWKHLQREQSGERLSAEDCHLVHLAIAYGCWSRLDVSRYRLGKSTLGMETRRGLFDMYMAEVKSRRVQISKQ